RAGRLHRVSAALTEASATKERTNASPQVPVSSRVPGVVSHDGSALCSRATGVGEANRPGRDRPLDRAVGQRRLPGTGGAMRQLRRVGPAVIPSLREAAKDSDLEVRTRIRELLEGFEAPLIAARDKYGVVVERDDNLPDQPIVNVSVPGVADAET